MMYVSKGMVLESSTEVILKVCRCNQQFTLYDVNAAMWLNGRLEDSMPSDVIERCSIDKLERMGLVECTDETGSLGRYRLLTGCIICPAQIKKIRVPLNKREKWLWHWINEAGLRLTISELVCLAEHDIQPLPALTGAANRQALTEKIYNSYPIGGGLLEHEMEKATVRDEIVTIAFRLLAKKRLLLL